MWKNKNNTKINKIIIVLGLIIAGIVALAIVLLILKNKFISEKEIITPSDEICKIAKVSTGCNDLFSQCELTMEQQSKSCDTQIKNNEYFYNFEFTFSDASCNKCQGLGDSLLCKYKVCWKEKLVETYTEKTNYMRGENVVLVLKNHYTFTTYIFDRDDIQVIKYNEATRQWEMIPSYWLCSSENCIKNCEQKNNFPEIHPISDKYDNSKLYIWDQEIKDCNKPGLHSYPTTTGKYKAMINISVAGEKFKLYSNEFEIK